MKVYDNMDDYQKHIRELNNRLNIYYNPKPVFIAHLFTPKGIMISQYSQFLFNQMFEPYSDKEIQEIIKRNKMKANLKDIRNKRVTMFGIAIWYKTQQEFKEWREKNLDEKLNEIKNGSE